MVYNLLHSIVDHTRRPGTMTELKAIKCRMYAVYEMARQVDPSQLVACSTEIQAQYRRIMDTWRKVQVVLDSITSKSSLAHQEAALERVTALLASLPGWQIK